VNPLRQILIAEDNAADLELTMAALKASRFANPMDTVRDGAEALDYLLRQGRYADRTSGDPLFVLLDLKMPKVDGLEVLRVIKSDERVRRIPVVMLTSSREEGDLVRSYDLGVNAYVVKPVEFGEFLAAVKELGTFWALLNEAPPPLPPAGRGGLS
jgi:CheY-like chemotaxis protein